MIDENYLMLEQKVIELIEHRNETLRQWKNMEDEGWEISGILYELDVRSKEFEILLTELGQLVGVECRQSDGK